jgi:hypothetical protein
MTGIAMVVLFFIIRLGIPISILLLLGHIVQRHSQRSMTGRGA